jgi:hypothetical protein
VRVADCVREFDCDWVCDDVAAPECVVDAVIVSEADMESDWERDGLGVSLGDGDEEPACVSLGDCDCEGVKVCDTEGVCVALGEEVPEADWVAVCVLD